MKKSPTTEAAVANKKATVKKRNPIAGTMPGWKSPKYIVQKQHKGSYQGPRKGTC